MTVHRESSTLEGRIAAPPARVFACWSDPAQQRRWFDSDGPGWKTGCDALDFHVGGTESGSFVLKEGPTAGRHQNRAHYLGIVPDECPAFACTMAIDGRIHSASLATVTFEDGEGGTLVRSAEQGLCFGGTDGVALRSTGWPQLLGALAAVMTEEPANA